MGLEAELHLSQGASISHKTRDKFHDCLFGETQKLADYSVGFAIFMNFSAADAIVKNVIHRSLVRNFL
jgi:hypothetical protein